MRPGYDSPQVRAGGKAPSMSRKGATDPARSPFSGPVPHSTGPAAKTSAATTVAPVTSSAAIRAAKLQP